MQLITKAVLLSLVLATTGCDNALLDNSMQKLVRQKLKDPDSAKWGEKLVHKNRACLQVNSKNSYGGYTGNQTAWLHNLGSPASPNWYLERIDEETCYQHVLEERSNRDDAEKAFEVKMVAALKSIGFKIGDATELSGLRDDDPSINKCLKVASGALTSFRIASDYQGKRRDEWESKAKTEFAAVESGGCKT